MCSRFDGIITVNASFHRTHCSSYHNLSKGIYIHGCHARRSRRTNFPRRPSRNYSWLDNK